VTGRRSAFLSWRPPPSTSKSFPRRSGVQVLDSVASETSSPPQAVHFLRRRFNPKREEDTITHAAAKADTPLSPGRESAGSWRTSLWCARARPSCLLESSCIDASSGISDPLTQVAAKALTEAVRSQHYPGRKSSITVSGVDVWRDGVAHRKSSSPKRATSFVS